MQGRFRHHEQCSWAPHPYAFHVSFRTHLFPDYPAGPECVELADNQMMHAINLSISTSSRKSKSPGPYAESDSLFLKLQGTPQSIAETSKVICDILSTHGCDPQKAFRLARNEDEAREMWDHRRNALYASMKMVEGGRVWSTDVWFVICPSLWIVWVGVLTHFRASSVPVSDLPRLVYETKEDAKSEGIEATIVGHVGDGKGVLSFWPLLTEEYQHADSL